MTKRELYAYGLSRREAVLFHQKYPAALRAASAAPDVSAFEAEQKAFADTLHGVKSLRPRGAVYMGRNACRPVRHTGREFPDVAMERGIKLAMAFVLSTSRAARQHEVKP